MSMNFENYVKEANTWSHELCKYLGIDDVGRANRIFRAVLHAIRDRIHTGEAMHLAAQLPVIWRGIFFEGYHLHTPVTIRHDKEWLDFIRSKDTFAEMADFPTLAHAHSAFVDVMHFLRDHISEGEYKHIEHAMHSEIKLAA